MKYQLPPMNGLVAFEAAARNENFSKAALELSLTQSTISHRVRMLENHLGYPLFERLPRGLRLTESGKAYLPSIRNAFEQIFSSTSGIFGYKGKGSLTVRAPISYSVFWLGPIIHKFLEEYPAIDVRLISSIWAEDLAIDETDIDLRLGFGSWPGSEAQPVLRDTVLPVCCPALVKSKPKGFTSIEEFMRYPLVHVMGIEDLWMKYFSQSGLKIEVKPGDIHVDSAAAALEIAASGDYIALIQQRFLKQFLDNNRLTIPLHTEMEMEQAIYLVRARSPAPPKPEALLFNEWLGKQ